MSDKKYLVLEEIKLSNTSIWNVRFYDLNEDKAFEKLVALRTLNEDDKNKFHYIVDMSYLWKKDEPLVLTKDMEVKEEQSEMPF
jgi:hypothetical protein